MPDLTQLYAEILAMEPQIAWLETAEGYQFAKGYAVAKREAAAKVKEAMEREHIADAGKMVAPPAEGPIVVGGRTCELHQSVTRGWYVLGRPEFGMVQYLRDNGSWGGFGPAFFRTESAARDFARRCAG